ncbi:hypothetical protein DRJ27_04565 [Candidatus Acetothermia bacterium]|nr:MAG: hypothetical protein DRJ27_04565 [Candidatus Acetothermia bacterium]
MRLTVVDERKEILREPYVLRLGGWTLERYLAEAPESQLWEFVRGEVIMYSPVTGEHQDLVRFLLRLLDGYCEAKAWGKVLTGPAAIRVLPDVIREPDIFVLPPEEVPKATGVPLEVRPALVIEVTSPTTRTIDLVEKAQDYAAAGIPEYWVVDPERKEIALHRLAGERYEVKRVKEGEIESSAVPDFWLKADWLFREPLPSVADCLRAVLGGEGTE